ncbi:uncharacterized protein LOC144914665 [Branchiostoma floridae x Branchiostoma belcheri]
MPTAMFFPLLFLLACAAEGHVLARDTRTTTTTPTFWTTTTQQLPCWAYLKFTCPDLNCQGHAFVPHDYDNCRCGYCICPTDPSSGTTSRPWSCPTTVYTTVPTTTPTITTAYLTTPTTTAPTTLATTHPLPCWLQSWRFTCPYNKPCVDPTPDDYSNCRCGQCPNGPNCYAWDGSIIPAGGAVEVDGHACQCPDYDPYSNHHSSLQANCYNNEARDTRTTTPTTTMTTTPTTTMPMTTAPTLPSLPCWLNHWKFTCSDYKPCVDPTPDDYSNCRCGGCPNGPNCYAWDGSIIPAGGAVEVDGHACQCPDYDPRNDGSLLANCYNDEGRPPCFTSDFTPVPAGDAVEVRPFIFCRCPDDGSPGSLAVCEVDWSLLELLTG